MSERLERIWAGWRSEYVDGMVAERVDDTGGSLFERILDGGFEDGEAYVLWRGEHCAALLNAYPYSTGHILVMPNRAVCAHRIGGHGSVRGVGHPACVRARWGERGDQPWSRRGCQHS